MSTCWQVLQIEPTTNLEIIKDARRALIKTWHPDRVADAEQKLEYTARCAGINAAFDEASGFAKAWTPPRVSSTPPADRADEPRRRRLRHGGPITDFVTRAAYVFVTVFSILVLSIVSKPVGRITLFVVPFALCIFTAGFANSLLLKYALSPVLAGLKERKTAAWLMLSAVNIAVLAVGLSQIGGTLFGTLGGAAFDAAVGLVIPVYVSMSSMPDSEERSVDGSI